MTNLGRLRIDGPLSVAICQRTVNRNVPAAQLLPGRVARPVGNIRDDSPRKSDLEPYREQTRG
jgi:hypothetical protein